MKRELEILAGSYWLARLPPDAPLPPAPASCELWSATRSATELSIFCTECDVPAGAERHGPLSGIRLCGVLELDLVGVLESLLAPLRQAGISVLATSTYDTDYIFVAADRLESARRALGAEGFRFGEAG